MLLLDDAPEKYQGILQDADNKKMNAMRNRLDHTRLMTNIACDETKSDFDFDNCAYSLKMRKNNDILDHYNSDYTLGLLCNVQPGMSTIFHIYPLFLTFFFSFVVSNIFLFSP